MLLVVFDCGWDWEVSRRMLCVYQVCVSLAVFHPDLGGRCCAGGGLAFWWGVN